MTMWATARGEPPAVVNTNVCVLSRRRRAAAVARAGQNTILEIVDSPATTIEVLGQKLPMMSGFYFDYLMICNLAGGVLTLLRCASLLQARARGRAV